MRKHAALIAFVIALLFCTPSAFADQIDGKWCNGAKSFAIDGPTITLPSGNQHQGDYTRHGFDYVVPDGEPGAGDRVQMSQQSDELLHVQRTPNGATQAGAIERWQRCANIS